MKNMRTNRTSEIDWNQAKRGRRHSRQTKNMSKPFKMLSGHKVHAGISGLNISIKEKQGKKSGKECRGLPMVSNPQDLNFKEKQTQYVFHHNTQKTLESPLDCKEIQSVHPKDQSWVFIGRTDAEAETPLWPPDAKT